MNPPSLPMNLVGPTQTLQGFGHWPETSHVFAEDDIRAINMALASGRPLLLRGEPGCGKSQLARAAAEMLEWPLLARVVNGRCEPEDLLYRFDAVARLAKAQILPKTDEAMKELAAEHFLLPEILWWALNPENAAQRYHDSIKHCGAIACDYGKETRYPFAEDKGCVVLIDEIDKADSEVPNSLLEAFSLGGFGLPYGGGSVTAKGVKSPLIIVTTNEDRELPPAFVRRCLVHQMDPPKDGLKAYFGGRARAHFPDKTELSDDVLGEAIGRLIEDRALMKSQDLPQPGLAELLDLLRAVVAMGKGTDLEEMKSFVSFAFRKHRLD
ncbi:MAG: MoxR family ATPase [Verrucomicrobia bacterium]|nr:MoxR family ATPase [Verrucomicrobiota bacterium]